MTDRFSNILSHTLTAAAVGLAFTLQSCTNDTAPLHEPDTDGLVQVGFSIKTVDNFGKPAPRAAADGYVDGTGYENYIGFESDDIIFMLFDGNGKYVETMGTLGVTPIGDDKYPSEYKVVCVMTRKPGDTFRIMALANWGHGNYPVASELRPGVTTIEDICLGKAGNNIYEYSRYPFVPSGSTAIPMYGVKTFKNVDLQADRINDIGDIDLLRAMAKVEVCCAEGSELELESVTLSGFNNIGFTTPTGMYDNTGYATDTHIPASASSDTEHPLDFTISGNKALIYIPEYKNIGSSANPCRITVTFADNKKVSYPIDFCKYSNGKPTTDRFDILRNTYYQFIVDRKAGFIVDVIPYSSVPLEPEFGL